MKINFSYLFFLLFLFPLRTEAGVTISSVATPREHCPYDNFPDNNDNVVPGVGYCSFTIIPTGIKGSDNSFIEADQLDFYVGVGVLYRYSAPLLAGGYSMGVKEGTVNELAALAISTWNNGYINIPTYSDNPIVKLCFIVGDIASSSRPEFGNECNTAGPGPGPGSCDLGGPYYLSHGSIDVNTVNGNEARVNINVTCSQDAILTFTAPNELDLGQNIVSQITLDGLKPDGLNLEFSKPGRSLLFASKLQTIGTPEAGTFDKVYLLQATIQ